MKIFGCIVLFVGMMSSFAVQAQSSYYRRDDAQVKIEIPLEFKIGNSNIRIGGKNFDGRDYRGLNERIRNLEQAVQFLLENQGYRGSESRWECALSSPFSGMFLGKGESELSAISAAIGKCREGSPDSYDTYCTESRMRCSELK